MVIALGRPGVGRDWGNLEEEASDTRLPPETRDTAQAALSHLFSYALEE
jgi:hypothetical protein